jgi:hypothetical protein
VNIREFYAADPRRRESVEISFGAGWTDQTEPASTFRVSWVVRTRELYAVREPHPGGGLFAPVLDHYNLRQASVDKLRVEILAVADLPAIETALAGWRDVVPEHDSLRWARRRIAALSSPPSDAAGAAPAQDGGEQVLPPDEKGPVDPGQAASGEQVPPYPDDAYRLAGRDGRSRREEYRVPELSERDAGIFRRARTRPGRGWR